MLMWGCDPAALALVYMLSLSVTVFIRFIYSLTTFVCFSYFSTRVPVYYYRNFLLEEEQDMQCTYNITLRCVRETTVVAGKQ
jgi:hypothetical protein